MVEIDIYCFNCSVNKFNLHCFLGRTHSPMYHLWEEGTLSSPGVMEYVEEGTTGTLDQEVQGMDGILDIFNAKNLELGIGTTSVNVLADPFHSKVRKCYSMVSCLRWSYVILSWPWLHKKYHLAIMSLNGAKLVGFISRAPCTYTMQHHDLRVSDIPIQTILWFISRDLSAS